MILITGLGPGELARIPGPVLDILLDPERRLIIRTAEHPAAAEIAALRPVVFCDDLYRSEGSFEDVYAAIADRVIAASADGPVIYAVPGGPTVGEFAVAEIVAIGDQVEILSSETFVDAILSEVGYDPLRDGLQLLNGHQLPFPLVVDKPTIVAHLDRPEILADVCADLSRVLPEDAEVRVFSGLGGPDAVDWSGPIDEVDPDLAGFRTSLWIDGESGGIVGVARAMERLRRECPWDREQTHQSLTKYLIEEAYELIEAVSALTPDDLAGYAWVEEELGDVLLQVLFQAAIASEKGAFDIDDVAEVLRRKLVRRHPHVFGEVEVADAAEVKSNWDAIKRSEKGEAAGPSRVPEGIPALHRAPKVQNRAIKEGHDVETDPTAVRALIESGAADEETLGKALFAIVDLARRSGIDPELALRREVTRFEERLGGGDTVDEPTENPGEAR